MDQAMRIFECWQRQVREIYAVARTACIDIVHHLAGNKIPNVLLRFCRTAANVWRKDCVGKSAQLRLKLFVVVDWLVGKNVDGTSGDRTIQDALTDRKSTH